MDRRNFMQVILAAAVAPAVVKASSLMKVRRLESGLLVQTNGVVIASFDGTATAPTDGMYLVVARALLGSDQVLTVTRNDDVGGVMIRGGGETCSIIFQSTYLRAGDKIRASAPAPLDLSLRPVSPISLFP